MSISMTNLPNELLLKICRILSINDFAHLSSTSRHLYQFGQNFQEEIFNSKTRLVLSDRHTVIENRLLKKCFDLCMEQSSEQITTELPPENIAELTINFKRSNFEILDKFANITQLIVTRFNEHSLLYRATFAERLIPLLTPFPRLRMLKIIAYSGVDWANYRGLLKTITNMNFANLRHLSIYSRKQAKNSMLSHGLNLSIVQKLSQLNEFYVGGSICDDDECRTFFSLLPNESALRRLGLYFDKAQTCFQHLNHIGPFLGNQITHLAIHSQTNDYDTLTDRQLQQISNIFHGVQNFTPKALDDKIKEIKLR